MISLPCLWLQSGKRSIVRYFPFGILGIVPRRAESTLFPGTECVGIEQAMCQRWRNTDLRGSSRFDLSRVGNVGARAMEALDTFDQKKIEISGISNKSWK